MAEMAKLFTKESGEKNELASLKASLAKDKDKVEALQDILAMLSVGKKIDIFADVLRCLVGASEEVKKLAFMCLAHNQGDSVAVEALITESSSTNPIIRAFALKVIGSIAAPSDAAKFADVIVKRSADNDPYVVKAALLRTIQLHALDAAVFSQKGILKLLQDKISDPNPLIVATATCALNDINHKEALWTVSDTHIGRLLGSLEDSGEWSTAYLLQEIANYVPRDSGEAFKICEKVFPRLQHGNSSIVLASLRVLLNYMDLFDITTKETILSKFTQPLVSGLSKGNEVKYVVLRNINLILQKVDKLSFDLKVFFCSHDEPVYVRLEKLDIMVKLATEQNVDLLLQELKEYCEKVETDFVRKSVRTIGRCAIKLQKAADNCVRVLLDLVNSTDDHVLQEVVIAFKDIYRRYPGRFENDTLALLCQKIEFFTEPGAKVAIIWILGEYANRIDKCDVLLEHFKKTFPQEPVIVQLHLLTSMVKLFLKKPSAETKLLVEETLDIATKQTDNPDVRDRGFVYWRLLASFHEKAKHIVLVPKPAIDPGNTSMDPVVLSLLIRQVGTVSSVYHKTPETFLKNTNKAQVVPLMDFNANNFHNNDYYMTNSNLYATSMGGGIAFDPYMTNLPTATVTQAQVDSNGGEKPAPFHNPYAQSSPVAESPFSTNQTPFLGGGGPTPFLPTSDAPFLPAHSPFATNVATSTQESVAPEPASTPFLPSAGPPTTTPFLPSSDAPFLPSSGPPPLPSLPSSSPFLPGASSEPAPFLPGSGTPFLPGASSTPFLPGGSEPEADLGAALPFMPSSTPSALAPFFESDLPLLFPLLDHAPNGLQINGSFGIQVSGDIYEPVLNLFIGNLTSEPINSLQIKFNKNIYQIGPQDIDPNLTIPAGGFVNVALTCGIGVVPTNEVHTESIQIALKSSVGVCVFESCLPLSLVLVPEGNLQRAEYFELWDTIQQEVSDHIGYSLYQDTQGITGVLERYNIFVVDDKDQDGSPCLLLSAKIGVDDTILLMKLILSNDCKFIIKTDVVEYIQLIKDVVIAVLTQQH